MTDLWMMPIALFFAWLFIFGMARGKVCPDCSRPLQLLQSPFTRTRRQWVEGGYLCQNCGCETDIAGRKVAAGTPLSFRALGLQLGLLTLAAIPLVVLMVMLLHR